MIEVRIEILSFRDVNTKRRLVVITSQHIIHISRQAGVMRSNFRKILWPETSVCIFSLMDCKVWGPDAVVNHSLSEIPFLEIVSLMLLVGWVYSWKIHHLVHELSLLERLVNQQVILSVDCSMAPLARS